MTDELKWYVVHTYSGYEEKAKNGILERAKLQGLESKVGEIYIPQTQKESITKSGKKKVVSRTSYPGYIIVQLHLDEESMHLVKGTPKVTGFIGDAKNPRPLPDHEVLALTNPDSIKAQEEVIAENKFVKGDSVKVIDGPFSNFDGIIDEVRPEKSKVRVLVSIFGRETPVELEYRQIEQI